MRVTTAVSNPHLELFPLGALATPHWQLVIKHTAAPRSLLYVQYDLGTITKHQECRCRSCFSSIQSVALSGKHAILAQPAQQASSLSEPLKLRTLKPSGWPLHTFWSEIRSHSGLLHHWNLAKPGLLYRWALLHLEFNFPRGHPSQFLLQPGHHAQQQVEDPMLMLQSVRPLCPRR